MLGAPSFSVVIPVYNGAATLGRAIDSVLAQSWPAQEIIVVDDGSTDASAEVAASYGGVVQLIRQANAGVAAARNRGAAEAHGEWLTFLDADDWYYPDRLRWHAEWIARDPALDFLTGDYEYRRPDGTLIGLSMEKTDLGRRLKSAANERGEVLMQPGDLGEFVADHFGDTHTLSVRRATFLALGGYPAGFKICEDVYFLTCLCARARRVGVVCRLLAVYLIHDQSATRANRVQAQIYNVQTLLAMRKEARTFPRSIRSGQLERLRKGRQNLAYAYLQGGQRAAALAAVLPSIAETPGIDALRGLATIIKACICPTRR
jgi:hypothetical protein